jgi:hypothetical protein
MLNNLDTVLAVYFSADPARGDPPLPADLVSLLTEDEREGLRQRLCCVTRVCERELMGRMNWSRIATRDRMRRHGVEDVKGKMPFVAEPPKPQPRRKLSKGELRQQTAAAFLVWRAGQTSKKDK